MKAFTSDTPALRWCRKHAQGIVCASVKGFDGTYWCRFEEPVFLVYDPQDPSGFEELWVAEYYPYEHPAGSVLELFHPVPFRHLSFGQPGRSTYPTGTPSGLIERQILQQPV